MPDGIYFSQVIDVCRYWEATFNERAHLVAFVSLRDYFVSKRKIRSAYRHSVVLPMFPGIENWKKNLLRLQIHMFFRRKQKVIARGVFATLLAMECKKFNKVCFDARGAYLAEWSEYLKSNSPTLASQMKVMEKQALNKSYLRIAVSQKLVDYWRETYGYASTSHVVIPCTLDSSAQSSQPVSTASIRTELGLKDTDIILVYSGSSAQWQSFEKLEEAISIAFTQNADLKLLMLCKPGGEKLLADKFPGRVAQAWVRPYEVSSYLNAADYGLLIREASVTNKVSSPVKFAEYLAAGLPVIISENIGDYSAFVKDKNCGILVDSTAWASMKRNSESERARIKEIAKTYFTKQAYKEQYTRIQKF